MVKPQPAQKPVNYLDIKTWEKLYLDDYQRWLNTGWGGAASETRRFVEHISSKTTPRAKLKLYPHQREALLRAIYSFEVLGLNPILLNLATGTGKTVIMAAFLAWLKCRYPEKIKKYIILCPNTIVRDRLKRDFNPKNPKDHVFYKFDFFPSEFSNYSREIRFSIVEAYEGGANIRGYHVIVTNRHQLQRGYKGGQDHLKLIIDQPGELAVFNDEAHNTKGDEYEKTLSLLGQKTVVRLDVTATPERADLKRPDSHEVYQLTVREAMDRSLVKDVIVQRPNIRSYGAIAREDLVFSDKKTGQKYNIREIDWDDLTLSQSTQLIMDPAPLKMQLDLAVKAWKQKKLLSKNKYKPLLFCVAPSIAGAEQIEAMLKNEFKMNPLLVVDKESEYDKPELRELAASIGTNDAPFDSVVSVYMLREGWDVPQVSIMCLLRGFGSNLFAEQILGRGLRLIRENGLENDKDAQELWVIDHPALKLDWLWENLGVSVTDDIEALPGKFKSERKKEEKETLELPAPQIIRQELYDLLFPIPSILESEPLSTSRALELLSDTLHELGGYRPEDLIYVEATIEGTKILRRKSSFTKDDIQKYNAIPQDQIGRETLQRYLQDAISQLAKELECIPSFHNQKQALYECILREVERNMLLGQHITIVQGGKLLHAYHTMSSLKDHIISQVEIRIRTEEELMESPDLKTVGTIGLKLPDLPKEAPKPRKGHILENPKKSPFDYEVMDSKWAGELRVAYLLEENPDVIAWTKNHSIKIPYRDQNAKKRLYQPDFLILMKSRKQRGLIEVKGKHLASSSESKAKEKAGKRWCELRGMFFVWKVV